jgi:hypothetical protein
LFIVGYLIGQHATTRKANASGAIPVDALLEGFERMLTMWVNQGRLNAAAAEMVMEIIRRDRAALHNQPPAEAPTAAPHFLRTEQVSQIAASSAPPRVAHKSVPVSETLPPTPTDPEPPAPPRPSRSDQFWAGLLALRTRWTLLFLGAFLLVVSALILVVFNWNDFPAIIRSLLIASVAGGLWGGGVWLARQPGLKSAGINLQAVGGLLVPVAAYSLSHPDIFNLTQRNAWLLSSALSLPIYMVAAWRSRQLLFSICASLACASAVLAGVRMENQWLPAMLALTMTAYLPLVSLLRRRNAAELAQGPFWVAHVGLPLSLLAALLLNWWGSVGTGVLATTFWLGSGFYLLACWQEPRSLWANLAAGLPPFAVFATLVAWEVQPGPQLLILLALVAVYLLLNNGLRLRVADNYLTGLQIVAHAGLPLLLLAGGVMLSEATISLVMFAAVLWAGMGCYTVLLGLETLGQQARVRYAHWVAPPLLPFTVLATLHAWEVQAGPQLLILLVLAAAYLLLLHWLKGRVGEQLLVGLWTVTHAGLPLVLVAAALLRIADSISSTMFAGIGWAGLGCYLLVVGLEWLDKRATMRYGHWVVAALLPMVVLATLDALGVQTNWLALPLALLAPAYLAAGAALERRAQAYALPAYLSVPGLVACSMVLSMPYNEAARFALPLLIGTAAATVVLCHRGYFAWLAEGWRTVFAVIGLATVGLLLPWWGVVLLDLTSLTPGERALVLLPLAGLAFAAACWWPGRLRRPYDLTLQTLGVLLLLGMTPFVLLDNDVQLAGAASLTAIWLMQTLLQRRWWWAAVALGHGLLLGAIALAEFELTGRMDNWIWLGLGFTLAYTMAGTLLQRDPWHYWTWPALIWGTIVGLTTLGWVPLGVAEANQVLVNHVLVVAALAGLLALMSYLWRRNELGYPAALLLATTVLMAATRGFFTTWQPTFEDYSLVICGVAAGLVALGLVLRRTAPGYALPHELVGYGLLPFAPAFAYGDARTFTLTWLAMLLLYGYATWRYRLAVLLVPTFLTMNMAMLSGAAWLLPGGNPAGAGQILLLAAWVQGLCGLWFSKRRETGDGRPEPGALPRPETGDGRRELDADKRAAQSEESSPLAGLVPGSWFGTPKSKIQNLKSEMVLPAYAVALVSGVGALGFASGDATILARVGLGLAVLAALLASVERREGVAWLALVSLACGLGGLHEALGQTPLWSMAWGVAESLALCILGWLLEVGMRGGRTQANARTQTSPLQTTWRLPLLYGTLGAGAALTTLLGLIAPTANDLPPLTFALATLGLLLATVAVREREVMFGYVAGAALVGAGMCQLADWGFTEPQWYVIPAGLYLLALAEGLRRFQGQRQVSQIIEAGAALLLLGTTLGQSLRETGATSTTYALWLCGESLLVVGYGVVRKLRVPFFGGIAFFLIGVTWLSIDPLQALNQWVLLGIVGLLLVGAYVLLERRQEQLVRAGRALVEQVRGWG